MTNHDFNEALRVGVHESGHAWIAQCVGVKDFRAVIHPGIWLGGSMTYKAPANPYHGRLIGLGGLVAELCLRSEDVTPAHIVAAAADRNCISISPEDRAVTGPIDLQLAGDTLHLVRQNMGGIRSYGAQLISDVIGARPEPALQNGRRPGCVYL